MSGAKKKLLIGMNEGLFIGGKHIDKMGMAVWLFGYYCAKADWKTGLTQKLTYKKINKKMGVSIRTICRWHCILHKHKYILVSQAGNGFNVGIQKWISRGKTK